MPMFFGSKKLLGIDIGSTSIKLSELDYSKSSGTLQNFMMMPIPIGTMGGGEILDVDRLSSTLTRMVKDLKSGRKSAAIGMWGTSVFIKRISIPKVDAKLIAEQLRFEAEQHIPFDINNVSLSHHVLPFLSTSETVDILLIAAQNEVTRQYVDVLETAELSTSVVDISGFALANLFEFNYGKSSKDNFLILNIGAQVTNFVAIESGEVIFCRDIPVGGSSYNSEISKNFGLTFQEAESLKLSASKGQEVPEGVSQTITQVNDQIFDEIRSTLDFLKVTNQGTVISKVYFTGGGSLTPGLIPVLSKSLELQFEALNPYRKITSGKKVNSNYLQQIAPFVSISLGLGLRQAGDS
jgi:type IV pilus assembly protein PilM